MAEGTAAGHWRTLTLLSGLSREGVMAAMTIESPTDGDVLLTYVEQVLCPRLRPGQVVVLDNLPAHKVDGVRNLIKTVGAELLYWPPYSPDFNPIEPAWSKIKQQLRSAKARTLETLQAAVTPALTQITIQNAAGRFTHCDMLYGNRRNAPGVRRYLREGR